MPRPSARIVPEVLADGAGDVLAVGGDEVREVGRDMVQTGAAGDSVGLERKFGGPGPKRTMATTPSRGPFGIPGGRVWLR